MIGELEMFGRSDWQMSLGERAALEGVVAQMKPDLSIEIGTAEGGSLRRIAAHSAEVHSVDLTHELVVDCPDNAELHSGDSAQVLPGLLTGFAADGRNVDFVLVDGDHSTEGVRADLAALLESPAVGQTLILLHDSFDADVRSGIEAARPADHSKVLGFDLDFVPGRLGKLGAFADRLLGGFALVIVDAVAAADGVEEVELGFWTLNPSPVLFHDAHETIRRGAERVGRERGDRAVSRAGLAGLRRLPGRIAAIADALRFPDGGTDSERHWQRAVLNNVVNEYIASLQPTRRTAAEISGETHARKPWREYSSLMYPDFDLCAPPEGSRRFDVVICEQVLEHVDDPWAAAANLRALCEPGGHVIVSTPFLVKVHELPLFGMGDFWRFTPRGLRTLLERAGLEVERVESWGNRQCVRGNFNRWSAYRPWHSLRNEPDFPLQVWAFARNAPAG